MITILSSCRYTRMHKLQTCVGIWGPGGDLAPCDRARRPVTDKWLGGELDPGTLLKFVVS